MKKFIVPNRKKRRYIRKEKKQKIVRAKRTTSALSRPKLSFPTRKTITVVGLIILFSGIWYIGTHISFHMPPLPNVPYYEFPNVTIPTIAIDWNKYITMVVNGIVTFITTIATVLYSILLEIVKGIIFIIEGIWHMITVLWEGLLWLVVTVSHFLLLIFGWLINSIIKLLVFILFIIGKSIQEILKLLGMAIVSLWDMIQYIWQGIVSFISYVLYLLGTPFRKLADFRLAMQPYIDVLLMHVQDTFDELNNGYKNLIHIGDLLK